MAQRKAGTTGKKNPDTPGVSIVSISGPAETLQALLDVGGLDINEHSEELLSDGRWSVSAYATEAALGEVRARGCTVAVLMSERELRTHQEKVFQQVERPRPPRKGKR